MLQKELNSLRTKFYHDVEKLGFTSPVANIAQKTGYAKGNISSILNRKLEPSEQFINKFYESFKSELESLQSDLFEPEPPTDGKQRKIDRLIQYLDNKNIDIAEFERMAGISNAYLRNTEKRGADLTLKILDRIKEKQPKIYCEVFEQENCPKPTINNNTDDMHTNNHHADWKAAHESLLSSLATMAESQKIATQSQMVLSNALAKMADLLGEVREVKTNLADAAYTQQIYRVMTNERQRVILENIALLRGLNKNELVNEARSTGVALLDEYEKTHTVSSDKSHKSDSVGS